MTILWQILLINLLQFGFQIVPTQAQDSPNFGGYGQAKDCPSYRCPKGQEPVPKWPLRLTSSGCSGLGVGIQMMSFGNKDNAQDPHSSCCDLRHACLQTCGSIKRVCDDEFSKCSKLVCVTMMDENDRKKCESSASVHQLMISMDPCTNFASKQASQCECVPTDRVESKRKSVLRAFYKKFNPDSVDKVPGLLKKVDSAPKMAGLLMKLYSKYPKVIAKIKDPQHEMMEKMMKDAESVEKVKSSKTDEPASDDAESNAEDLGVDEL